MSLKILIQVYEKNERNFTFKEDPLLRNYMADGLPHNMKPSSAQLKQHWPFQSPFLSPPHLFILRFQYSNKKILVFPFFKRHQEKPNNKFKVDFTINLKWDLMRTEKPNNYTQCPVTQNRHIKHYQKGILSWIMYIG